jgi:hypothetical protein
MNKRIQELELEAEHGTLDLNGPFTAEEFNQFMKKFAELIIKECANVAAEHGAIDIYEEIREHFGVGNE